MRVAVSAAKIAVLMVVGLGLTTGPARADAIDGDWCRGGDHMHIEGSTVVTPARNKLEGRYGRYRFSYVVPSNERGAGTEINMVMIRGQELVHLSRAGQAGEPEVWQRCKPIS